MTRKAELIRTIWEQYEDLYNQQQALYNGKFNLPVEQKQAYREIQQQILIVIDEFGKAINS